MTYFDINKYTVTADGNDVKTQTHIHFEKKYKHN